MRLLLLLPLFAFFACSSTPAPAPTRDMAQKNATNLELGRQSEIVALRNSILGMDAQISGTQTKILQLQSKPKKIREQKTQEAKGELFRLQAKKRAMEAELMRLQSGRDPSFP